MMRPQKTKNHRTFSRTRSALADALVEVAELLDPNVMCEQTCDRETCKADGCDGGVDVAEGLPVDPTATMETVEEQTAEPDIEPVTELDKTDADNGETVENTVEEHAPELDNDEDTDGAINTPNVDELTVAAARTIADTADPDTIAAMLDDERESKARKTLISHLEGLLTDDD